jgi:hypothetical protein
MNLHLGWTLDSRQVGSVRRVACAPARCSVRTLTRRGNAYATAHSGGDRQSIPPVADGQMPLPGGACIVFSLVILS